MLEAFPVLKSSRTVTPSTSGLATSSLHRLAPIKPAPPVTRIFILNFRPNYLQIKSWKRRQSGALAIYMHGNSPGSAAALTLSQPDGVEGWQLRRFLSGPTARGTRGH